ncbi:MAG TPA: hypothetical protein VFA75_01240 [Nevskia sp.]|jgi:hypothetical protein|nr:hypothetical protein [Nevskia sp.]
MIKSILTCLLFAGLSGAALADDPAPTSATAATTAKAVPAPGSTLCVQDTGSHIRPKPGECLPVAGRSYSREDMENTGSFSNSDALRHLDPSITTR